DELQATFLDFMQAESDGPGLMPVTQESWVKLDSTTGVVLRSSAELGASRLLGAGLPEFHRLTLGAESIHRRLLVADDANLQMAQVSRRRHEKAQARTRLSTLVDARRPHGDGAPLGDALRIIGRHEGIAIRTPAFAGKEEVSLLDYCEASGVRARRVRLSEEDRWWLGDSGAMLAFRRADDQPVVLLPGGTGRYRVVDPVTGESAPAGARTADVLRDASVLHPGLDTGERSSMRALLRVGGAKARSEIVQVVAFGLSAGLLALAPAVAVDLLIAKVIPAGDPVALIQFTAVLAGLAFVAALSHILRGTALMRLEGRLAARIGAAVWDRLLRLRSEFFRRFNAGDLAARSLVFQDVRDHVAGVAADALLSTLFALPALGLLFYYDAALGWAGTCLGLAALGVTTAFCIRQIKPQRRYLETSRRLLGDLQQFMNGIAKLRTTCAEDSAFAAWARRYREHKEAEIRLSVLNERLVAFSAAVPALGSAALFAVVAAQGAGGLATEDFLAVHTAAMVLFMAIVMLGNSARSLAFVKPACEQLAPILASTPGSAPRPGARVKLQGDILLDRVSFGYSEIGSMVLQELSIHARPGEFVAIVGESGAGKSTVFRLALGLEQPWSGAVYYDGRDLASLDVNAVRRQIGMVPQGAPLQNGTILDNIIGVSNDLTTEDAWRAAHQAVVDEDIRAMPMGLHTTVGENSATFSGGQGQRIRIAGALVRNPRLLFLDEPTSWLDTQTQARTMRGLEESASTRLVIAHRLSTIRMANRIYMLKAGQVVQVGGFDELLAADGPFRDLARRQLA
ncbi:MAG: ATP-binding cassette domain-containing protein, partial [Rhodospirillaceae bacterium]|nr:ATP-binding cassette domain-containing protein [Rhodospirillaceae bacterium]